MVDVAKSVREALVTCLDGNITYSATNVPVVDGFSMGESLVTHHVIIDNVSDSDSDNLHHHQSDVNVSIQVVTYVDGYSKTPVDTISGSVRALLQPTFSTNGLTISGGQVLNLRVTSPQGYLEEMDDNGTIIRKILNINFKLNHN
jgi:hypothetical protein